MRHERCREGALNDVTLTSPSLSGREEFVSKSLKSSPVLALLS